ncbi:MAG: YbaB/EbfC family nucleoid-associated protein [Myxococcota bacterium]
MDISQIMEMAGQLRGQMMEAQATSGSERHTGEAGGGLVKVVMSGRYEVLEVHIDPKALEASDRVLLEDLMRAAFNQATSKVGAGIQTRLLDFAQKMGLDPALLGGLSGRQL